MGLFFEPGVEVFAVEDTAIQIAWSQLPVREVTFEVGGASVTVDATPPPWYFRWGHRSVPPTVSGPGAVVVDGLEPGTDYEVLLSGAGLTRRRAASTRTLTPPPGRLLSKFATVSDMHIGETRVSELSRIREIDPLPAGLAPYPSRCAVAALAEAAEWGAELVVAKGDLTCNAKPEETAEAGRILTSCGVAVEALLGNHDMEGSLDVAAALTAMGIADAGAARHVDMAGVRLVLGHSPRPQLHGGRLDSAHLSSLIARAADADGPAVVALHHAPRRLPFNTSFPPAISWTDSRALVRGLSEANPNSVILAGHSHRNRQYRVGGVTVAEVGSTKDYPGGWAGYAVYEGGIRQVVRRSAATDVIAWTEITRRAIGGIWGWWSPGSLADRCWSLNWS